MKSLRVRHQAPPNRSSISAGYGACPYAILQIKYRSDRTDDAGVSIQSELLAEVVDALNSCAVRTENLLRLKFLQFVGSPIQCRVFGAEEVEAPDSRIDRSRPN